jgi:hypothetical protein
VELCALNRCSGLTAEQSEHFPARRAELLACLHEGDGSGSRGLVFGHASLASASASETAKLIVLLVGGAVSSGLPHKSLLLSSVACTHVLSLSLFLCLSLSLSLSLSLCECNAPAWGG